MMPVWCLTGQVVIAVIVDGLLKPHQPGSLLEPAKTYLFPSHWTTVPLSFGLLMCEWCSFLRLDKYSLLMAVAPWGGHAIFPNIYRDMRHPHKYSKGVDITYIFTVRLDC